MHTRSRTWLAASLILAVSTAAAAYDERLPGDSRDATDGTAVTAPDSTPADLASAAANPTATAATEGSDAGTTEEKEATVTAQATDDDDMTFQPGVSDFTVITLPTTLRMPRHRAAFRVTHRFNRPLGQGDFSDLVEDFFGFDAGAQIGLEFRFGLLPGWQIGINRTSDRTIQFFTQYNVAKQGERLPFTVDALATAEGTNNFRGVDPNSPTGKGNRSPGLGAVVSRTFGEHGSVFVVPMWVNNTSDLPSELVDDNSTFFLGVGARVRVRPSVYLVAEVVPRVAGFDPGSNQASFGIEKRVGGHSFQLNFSNGIGTTMAQVARGAANTDDWYLGFNITRKFF